MNREFIPQPWPPVKDKEILRPLCLNDPDAMFTPPKDQRREARRCCNPCPMRMDCLVQGYELGDYHGIRGGFTERERHDLLLRYPRATPRQIATIAFTAIRRHDIIEEYNNRLLALEEQ